MIVVQNMLRGYFSFSLPPTWQSNQIDVSDKQKLEKGHDGVLNNDWSDFHQRVHLFFERGEQTNIK